MKKTGFLFLVLCLLLTPSCQSPVEPEIGTSMGFSDLEGASILNVDFPHARVFRSLEEWEPFWASYCHNVDGNGDQIPAPVVDFSSQMLVAVFYGAIPSGCRNWVDGWIESITQYPDRIEVQVGLLPHMGDCQASAYPLHVILVEHHDLPVLFFGHVPG